MTLLDPLHPFFNRPRNRWATAIIPALTGLVELAHSSWIWGGFFAALGGYAAWALFIKRPQLLNDIDKSK